MKSCRNTFVRKRQEVDMRRSTRTIRSLVVLGLLSLGAVTLMAHHSFDAEYDSSKTATVTGFVTKVDWVNPHAFIFMDSKDEKGLVRSFKIEMGPPYALARSGWKKDTLKVG